MARPTRPLASAGSSSISARNSFSASASRPSRARQSAHARVQVAQDPCPSAQPLHGLCPRESGQRLFVAPLSGRDQAQDELAHRAPGVRLHAAARDTAARARSPRSIEGLRQHLVSLAGLAARRRSPRAGRPGRAVRPGRASGPARGAARRAGIERERAVQGRDRLLRAAQVGSGSGRALPGIAHAGVVARATFELRHRLRVAARPAQGQRLLERPRRRRLVLGVGQRTPRRARRTRRRRSRAPAAFRAGRAGPPRGAGGAARPHLLRQPEFMAPATAPRAAEVVLLGRVA